MALPTKKLASIVMLGDVMLGRIVDEALTAWGDRKHPLVWGDTLPLLLGGMAGGDAETQLNTCNLECAVTDYTRAAVKTFNFKLATSNVDVLTKANIKFAALANNHSFDYFEAGALETVEVLTANKIACAGVGFAEEAAMPAVVRVRHADTSVAFLSYSDHYEEWAATNTQRGINFIDPRAYDRDKIAQHVQKAASLADLVIVFIHWGPNWRWQPSREIQSLAHDFVDLGAHAVFGHSAHHVQGIEVRSGKPIIYGAGGYLDDYALDETYRNDLGFLYCLHLDPEKKTPKELELVPTKIVHEWRKHDTSARPPYFSSVQRAVGDDKAWLLRTVRRLSSEFGTVLHDSPRGLRLPLV